MPFGSESREEGSALALSGDGYRAISLYLGTLIRLNERGLLGQLKRVLITAVVGKEAEGAHRGVGALVARYGHPSAFSVSKTKAIELSSIRTRLNAFSELERGEFIDLSYAVSDAEVSTHFPRFSTLG